MKIGYHELQDTLVDIKPTEITHEYDCEICKDRTYVECSQKEAEIEKLDFDFIDGKNVEKKTYMKKCVCLLAREFDNKLIKAGMSGILHRIKSKKYMQHFDWQKDYYQRLKNFVSNIDTGFIMSGTTGSGKTLLMGQMLYNFVWQGKSAFYLDWHNDFKGVVIDRFNVTIESNLKKIIDVDVLYIDDLFKTLNNNVEDLSQRNLEIMTLRKIIDRRLLDPNKKTMISTEIYENEMHSLDESLHGRLLELVQKKENWVQMSKTEERNIRKLIFEKQFPQGEKE